MLWFWEERYDTWVLVYGFMLLYTVPNFPPALALFGVLMLGLVAGRRSILVAREAGTVAAARAATGFQMVFLALFGAWATRWIIPATPYWVVSVPFLMSAVLLVVLSERRNREALPRSGVEALLVTCVCALYLLVRFRYALCCIPPMLVLHGGVLTLVVFRNSTVIAEHLYGPVEKGGYVEHAWTVRPPDPPGVKAVLRALRLPSAVCGLVLVIVECVALLIQTLA